MSLRKRKNNQDKLSGRATDTKPEAQMIVMPVSKPASTERQPQQQLRIGEVLKQERERRGYELQQIADYLCIRRGLLDAIENSRYDEFPADAYVIGFLRSYAEIIGLDGQEAINLYRQEMAGRRKKPNLILPTPVSESQAPTAVLMGATALGCLLIYILWYAFSTNDRTTVSMTPMPAPVATETAVPAETTTATSSTEPSLAPPPNPSEQLAATAPSGIAIAAPAPTAKSLPTPTTDKVEATKTPEPQTVTPPKLPASHISIKADQSSWILVTDNKGETVYDHVMKPGEIYQVPDKPGLSLSTGNGAGIIVSVDGEELPRLAKGTSHMVQNVLLEVTSLKNRLLKQ